MSFTNAVVDVCTECYGKIIGGTPNPDRYMVKERFLEQVASQVNFDEVGVV